ncbi:MAG: CHC2 zinc finger domain-containing protein [Candidatus Pacebacteria bacterium]|nr:CHC2 zinc finger domain-containing protein [Candidatus Paceibacterota bacterium]
MSYDMSGFDYNISDVVDLLRLTVRHRSSRTLDVDCPFCNYKKGKMNVNLEKNVFRCNYCDAQGGMLKLYSMLYNVTTSEANLQIREALNRGTYRTDYEKKDSKPKEPEIKNVELASPEIVDMTYRKMLDHLILTTKHREDLLHRGLTLPQIEEQRYRSTPVFGIKKLTRTLMEEGCTVKGVPGFYQDTDGAWTIHVTAKNSGVLIPVQSVDGLIQGFQIRADKVVDDRKYIWLSSVNYEQGVSSGSPVHVIGNLDAKVIYLTEGSLKGTIAHYLSGDTFICVAGVNQHRNLRPVLEKLKSRKVQVIWEAYDMDKKMRINCDHAYGKCGECSTKGKEDYCSFKAEKRKIIQKGCQKAYEICRDLDISMTRMVWDTDEHGEWQGNLKGIDDYYYDRKERKDEAKKQLDIRRFTADCSRSIPFHSGEADSDLSGISKGDRCL